MFATHRQFQHAERFFTVALPHSDDPNSHRSPEHIRNEVAAVAWSSVSFSACWLKSERGAENGLGWSNVFSFSFIRRRYSMLA